LACHFFAIFFDRSVLAKRPSRAGFVDLITLPYTKKTSFNSNTYAAVAGHFAVRIAIARNASVAMPSKLSASMMHFIDFGSNA
jgi:hypothetical protein